MKSFLKKQWSNILFLLVLILLIIPQTRMPIQVFVQRVISFSPSEIDDEDRENITDYNWRLMRLSGVEENLSQSEGRVILINFWATWCPPCVAEMPSLQSLYNHYEKDVDFYFVSDEEPGKINRFMEKNNYNVPIYRPKQATPSILNSQSLPTTFLIAKNGEIVIEKKGAAEWNNAKIIALIDDLLKN